jgi:transposase
MWHVGIDQGESAMEKYIVELTSEEQKELAQLVSKGKAAARKITHARVLLQANASKGGPAWTDKQISQAFGVHTNTIHGIRRRFVEHGLQAALERKKQDHLSRKRVVDGDVEAHLIALRCGDPPEGRNQWTLRLLADKLVELEIVPSICHETVRKTLKKTS